VDEIAPRGWTNLGGGMAEGFHQAHSFARRGVVSRVILLSDGLANRGITDPRQLGNIACRERAVGISLSTIGVGLEYNENLMLALSESGGGNYYFLESSRNLASVLEKEFNTVCGVLAQDARIDITLGRGVKVVDAIGSPFTSEGRDVRLEIGDLNAGEKREWTLVLDVPAGEGTMEVARGRLRYHSAAEGLAEARVEEFQTGIHYTERLAEVDDHRDKDVQARGDIAISTRKVEQAMQALDDGRRDEAEQRLHEARQMVAASPAAVGGGASAEMVRAQENKLSGYSTTLKEQDAGKAKKDIQYDNYRTQKKK
jgi:Ca-activated chloride channel homolog